MTPCSDCQKTEDTVSFAGKQLCKDCAVKAGWQPDFICAGCGEKLSEDEAYFLREESFCIDCLS
jgi:formylmethanofuran dehydrogenase subunit E